MLPFGIQPLHLVLVIIIALIIFGPQRLPEIGRGLGKSINEFRKGAKEMTDGFKDEVVKPEENIAQPAAAQPAAAPQTPMAAPAAAPATITCPSCSTANPTGAAFCNKCGTKLAY
jgi:TatA/E family protein of Tat protein translocase